MHGRQPEQNAAWVSGAGGGIGCGGRTAPLNRACTVKEAHGMLRSFLKSQPRETDAPSSNVAVISSDVLTQLHLIKMQLAEAVAEESSTQ